MMTAPGKNQFIQDLETRLSKIMEVEFINKIVQLAGLTGATENDALLNECKTSVVQDTGTGRVTVSYRFNDDTLVYGKLFSDELGPHSTGVLEALWETEFGKGQPFQVSEPLLYLSDYNLLITRAVKGNPLSDYIGHETPELLMYVRGAAQWLVRLHLSPILIGTRGSLWNSLKLISIVRQLGKSIAKRPHMRKDFIRLVDDLCEKGKQYSGQVMVQTHGRYHCEHIYVCEEMISVIDFDRSHPSDPAKDLAEFLNILRFKTFKQTGSTDQAESSTRIFLEEYLSQLPGNASNLAIHWGAYILLQMFRYSQRHNHQESGFAARMDYFQKEFESALTEKLIPV